MDSNTLALYPLRVWKRVHRAIVEYHDKRRKRHKSSAVSKRLLERWRYWTRTAHRCSGTVIQIPQHLADYSPFAQDYFLLSRSDGSFLLQEAEYFLSEIVRCLWSDGVSSEYEPRYGMKMSASDVAAVVKQMTSCTPSLVAYIAYCPELARELNPLVFEQLIGMILQRFGYQVQLTKRSGDDGVDIDVTHVDVVGITSRYIVECKRWRPSKRVSIDVVRGLFGAKASKRADHAVLVTTSRFTRNVHKALKDGKFTNLTLVDFAMLEALLKRYAQLYHKSWNRTIGSSETA